MTIVIKPKYNVIYACIRLKNSSKMDRRKIICVIFGVMTLPAVAQTDSVSKNVQLKEVVVAGDMAKTRGGSYRLYSYSETAETCSFRI